MGMNANRRGGPPHAVMGAGLMSGVLLATGALAPVSSWAQAQADGRVIEEIFVTGS